jgi:hypothetical protein
MGRSNSRSFAALRMTILKGLTILGGEILGGEILGGEILGGLEILGGMKILRGRGVELAGGEEAGVGALEEGDAGVGAELVVDLAVAGVYGENRSRAVLEHAVGEAAGGGSDVGAGEAFDGDVPRCERGFELEAAAGDVAEVVAEEADDDGVVDGGARLVDALVVDQDAAGEDERLRTLAGGGEGAVYEELVET